MAKLDYFASTPCSPVALIHKNASRLDETVPQLVRLHQLYLSRSPVVQALDAPSLGGRMDTDKKRAIQEGTLGFGGLSSAQCTKGLQPNVNYGHGQIIPGLLGKSLRAES